MSCKTWMKMSQTDEYERLTKFFADNEMEFDGEEEVDTDVVRCYKVTTDGDRLVGGVVLAKREGRYIIDGIAVDPEYRKHKIGKIMLKKVIEVTGELDGREIYLVARAPGFFKKYGFVPVDADLAPNFFECRYCPQYGVTCHPEILKLTLE
jgi:amino-acid N-acetyltransferase